MHDLLTRVFDTSVVRVISRCSLVNPCQATCDSSQRCLALASASLPVHFIPLLSSNRENKTTGTQKSCSARAAALYASGFPLPAVLPEKMVRHHWPPEHARPASPLHRAALLYARHSHGALASSRQHGQPKLTRSSLCRCRPVQRQRGRGIRSGPRISRWAAVAGVWSCLPHAWILTQRVLTHRPLTLRSTGMQRS